MQTGFLQQLSNKETVDVRSVSLLKLTECPAIGAVYLVAHSINYQFPFSYDNNYEIFFRYNGQWLINILYSDISPTEMLSTIFL